METAHPHQSGALVPIPRSTCGETRNVTSPPKVPAGIRKLISELGFRYRPTSQTDLEAHAARLALLAADLADCPQSLLDRAIREWAAKSPYMPKASDLISLAKSYQATARAAQYQGGALADRYNARLDASPEARRDIQWVEDERGLRLEWR